MDRRDLLRGLLGIAVGSGIKWEAKRAPTPKIVGASDYLAHRLRALHLSEAQLETFAAYLLTDTKQALVAPPTKKVIVKRTKFNHVHHIEWAFEDIKMEQKLTVIKMHLIDDLNVCVMNHTFAPVVHCLPKDTLRLYSVRLLF